MRATFIQIVVLTFLSTAALGDLPCPPVSKTGPAITAPPAGVNLFYRKYINANGISILGSGKVCDRSLQVASEIATHMLKSRTDYLKNLVGRGTRIVIFAVSEELTDLPEDRDLAGVWIDASHTRRYNDTCGGGANWGRPTAICERNLIGVKDPYFGRMSVMIHEFGHTIQTLGLDSSTSKVILANYAQAHSKRLFPRADGNPVSYMMSNAQEFFAEATGTWFNATDPTNPANSPAETGRKNLKVYDPELYQVLQQIYPDDDWKYPRR